MGPSKQLSALLFSCYWSNERRADVGGATATSPHHTLLFHLANPQNSQNHKSESKVLLRAADVPRRTQSNKFQHCKGNETWTIDGQGQCFTFPNDVLIRNRRRNKNRPIQWNGNLLKNCKDLWECVIFSLALLGLIWIYFILHPTKRK